MDRSSRRSVLASMLALLTSGAANAQQSPIKLTASEANAAALARQIVLIDIRTPDEWRETGVAASAHAITMHQKQEEYPQLAANQAARGKQKRDTLSCRR